MKPEDDEPSPSDDELREAQALAAALEGRPVEMPEERESGLSGLFGRRKKRK